MLFESELYQQYQQGLISAYEYALNVHRIVLEIEQAIDQCRFREGEAKKGHQRDEITDKPAFAVTVTKL